MTYHKLPYSRTSSRGIALLMTVMVLSVVLAVTLTIVELTLQQLAFSVDSRDSEIAFHAANAGLECARYTRRHASSTFEKGNAVRFNCFGSNPLVASSSSRVETVSGVDGKVNRYTASIAWSSNHCSVMDVMTMVSSTTDFTITGSGNTHLNTVFPNYPTKSKTCEAGAVCTIVAVSGYNSTCPKKDDPGVLKRQVLLEF